MQKFQCICICFDNKYMLSLQFWNSIHSRLLRYFTARGFSTRGPTKGTNYLSFILQYGEQNQVRLVSCSHQPWSGPKQIKCFRPARGSVRNTRDQGTFKSETFLIKFKMLRVALLLAQCSLLNHSKMLVIIFSD